MGPHSRQKPLAIPVPDSLQGRARYSGDFGAGQELGIAELISVDNSHDLHGIEHNSP